ncbi:MAG: S9 family peptidase, partial [Candidatus Latescibacteria bacterium]|nr:S9 family peptidase [Candidatus Latescibacterota bacterium]
ASFLGDGQRLVYLSNVTGNAELWQVDLADHSGATLCPDQLTFTGDRVMYVRCSPVLGDKRLLYAQDTGGNENAQLFVLNLETGQEHCLTEGYESAMHIPGAWSKDGQSLIFAANRRDPGIYDLYIQPTQGGPAQMIWQHDSPGRLSQICLSPKGNKAVMTRNASSFSHDLLEINLETGVMTKLNPEGIEAQYSAGYYSKDGQSLWVSTDLNEEFSHIARLDLETQTWEKILAPDCELEYLSLSADRRLLAYATNKSGMSDVAVFDVETQTERLAPMPGDVPGVVADLCFSHNSKQVAFSFSSAVRTFDIYVWDLEKDTVRAVTRSGHGGIPTDRFAGPNLIHYPSFDGREIPAWFYRPPDSDGTPAPTVVIVHGGPEGQSRPNFQFLAQYLIQHGYAVFVPNVRGSAGYGKTYGHLDDVEKRMDSVADLAYGAHWLKAQPKLDPNKIVVYGGSYGGFMVLAALTHHPDLWAAGVDIVGISNFATFLENTSAYRRAHREAEYVSLEHDREFLERIAPINHVDKIRAPVLVIHGANDTRVPLSEAEQLVEALKERNVPVEFLVFDDEGHGIVKLKNKRVLYPAIIAFLETHVLNGK